jgi:hypothetical protein
MSEAIARTLPAGRRSADPLARLRHVAAGSALPVAAAVISVAGALAITRGAFLVLLAVALATLSVVLLLTRPALGLLVFAGTQPALSPWIQVQLAGRSVGEWWGAGLLAAVLAYLALTRRPARPVRPGYTVPFAFLALYAMLTLFWRPNLDFAAISTVKLASWMLLALAAERIARSAAGQRLILRAGIAMAVVSGGAIAVAMAQNQYGSAYYYEDTFAGSGQTPHGYAGMVVLIVPFVLVALLWGRRVLVSSVLLAGLSVGLLLSYVRTGYVALAVLMVGYAGLGAARRRSQVLVAAVLGTVAIGVAVVVLGDAVSARLNDLANLTQPGGNAHDAGAGRLGFWSAVTGASVDSARMLAVGGGALASEAITTRVLGDNFWAHNDFVELLATGGLGLVLAYVALLAWFARSFWLLARDARQSPLARDIGVVGLLAFGAFVVVAIFNGVVTTPVVGFALLLGLARGMTATPGRTFVDRVPRAARVTDGPATAPRG